MRPRPCLALLLVVTLVIPPLLADQPVRAAATPGVINNTYISPTYGFLIRWDPNMWQVQGEQSQDGYDLLQLTDGTSNVSFEAFTGDDPQTCVEEMTASLATYKGVTNLDVVTSSSDPDSVIYPDEPFVLLTLDFESDAGRQRFAVYVECRTLQPGSSLLRLLQVTPADAFDTAAHVEVLLNSIYAPRRWYKPESSYASGSQRTEFFVGDPRSRIDQSSGDEAVVSLVDFEYFPEYSDLIPPAGMHYFEFTVTIKNKSDWTVPVNAGAIYVRDRYDFLYWNDRYRWDSAPGDPMHQVQNLPPGRVATVTVFIAVSDGIIPADIASVHCACFAPWNGADLRIATLSGRAGAIERSSHDRTRYSFILQWPPTLYFDRSGSEVGAITVLGTHGASMDEDLWQLVVAFENTGTKQLVVDASLLFFHGTGSPGDPAGPFWPESFTWERASGNPGAARQTLAPGERAVVRLAYRASSCLSASYLAKPDQIVPLVYSPCGAGAGGGRPRLRDSG